jgi:hypothetical protein
MEDTEAPKFAAVTYAILSLLVRLIASQSAVFTLWYGRRAYERSRGEMITMLYEKTLSRKVVSISSEAQPDDTAKLNGNGVTKKARNSLWARTIDFFGRSLGLRKEKVKDKSKELASMGKIMNLMR